MRETGAPSTEEVAGVLSNVCPPHRSSHARADDRTQRFKGKSERPRQRRWDVIGAPSSSSQGTGVHSKWGGDTPVLTLR